MSVSRNIYSAITIQLPYIVLGILLISTIWLGYYYYYQELDTKSIGLLGSVVSGLILVIVQFSFSWYEYTSISKIRKLRIINILLHRDDREFYQKLIKNSRRQIDVLGVTADRFMDHFADSSENSREEARVLLTALDRGVNVRILVPSTEFLVEETDKPKAASAEKLFKKTADKYPNFEYKYFKHSPAHSIVVIDDESLIGPVLTGVSSKNTPAIYLENSSPFAEKYLAYFEREWSQAVQQSKI